MNNIRDLICLHYVTDKSDTEFWKHITETEMPDSLANNLEMWRTRLPISDDLTDKTSKILFNEYNYILVMYGLGLIDTKAIQKQYESIPPEAKEFVNRQMNIKKDNDMLKSIPHKVMLDLIRRLT